MSKLEYKKLTSEADATPFSCILCIMKENAEIFPFLNFGQIRLTRS